MNQIIMQPFPVTTTQFGFGCSSLLGLLSERESTRLIDAAYDAGIRHFDVARSYGFGAVEALLGKALGARRGNVTITTKFGLPVPRSQGLVHAARSLARPLVKHLSGMRARSKSVLTAMAVTVDFNSGEAAASLEASLRALRTGYVDLFLLHEVRAGRLNDPSLLAFLTEAVQAGTIRGFGVGTDLTAIPDLIRRYPEYCPVVQHAASVFTDDVAIPAASFRICHGALLRSLDPLQRAIARDPQSFQDGVGMDLTDPAKLCSLLLRAAVLRHPGALTLFSARRVERIEANLVSLSDSRLDPYCARLTGFLSQFPVTV